MTSQWRAFLLFKPPGWVSRMSPTWRIKRETWCWVFSMRRKRCSDEFSHLWSLNETELSSPWSERFRSGAVRSKCSENSFFSREICRYKCFPRTSISHCSGLFWYYSCPASHMTTLLLSMTRVSFEYVCLIGPKTRKIEILDMGLCILQ